MPNHRKNHQPRDSVPSKVRQYRLSSGLTSPEVCVYSCVSPSTLKKIEAGETGIQLTKLFAVAYVLGVSPVTVYPALRIAPTKRMRFDHEPTPEERARRVTKLGHASAMHAFKKSRIDREGVV